MKHLHLTLALLLLLTIVCYAQQKAEGIVYVDKNQNGKLDRNEKGVPNVGISNGRHVVLTDANGRYTLPVQNDNIIFVIKPTGYIFPVDEYNQPQFYYIHKPLGSPKLKYEATKATGFIPKQLNFPLLETNEPTSFSAFVFGDPQVYNLEEIAHFENGIIHQIQDKSHALFGISLGDLVGDNLSLHTPYKQAIAKMNLPWWNVMGNHDMNYDVQVDSLSDESYEAAFGPNNFSFNYGNAHFIILDNIIYPNPKTGSGYIAGLRDDQFEFIQNDLKHVDKSKLIVLAHHIPIAAGGFDAQQSKRLFDLLADFPNTLSLSAHTHFQSQLFVDNQIGRSAEKPHHEYNVGTTSGDWYSGKLNERGVPASTMRDGTPKGYALLHINGNQYTFDYRVVGHDAAYKMNIISPEVVMQKHARRYTVYVNFFIGSSRDKIRYRINGADWKEATFVKEIDPSYNFKVQEFDFAQTLVVGKRPSNPIVSTHLWKFALPNLPIGRHTIEVEATDMFGRVHTAQKTIQVVANTD